ncbi:unnamed protein product, partial [Iphiclides podalirius]
MGRSVRPLSARWWRSQEAVDWPRPQPQVFTSPSPDSQNRSLIDYLTATHTSLLAHDAFTHTHARAHTALCRQPLRRRPCVDLSRPLG